MDMENVGLSHVSPSHVWVLQNNQKILLADMDIRLHTKTKLYQRDGHVFYNVTSAKVQYTISRLRLRLDNLFEGIKLLGMYTASAQL